MKRKLYAMIFPILIIMVVGGFYYDKDHSKATATLTPNDHVKTVMDETHDHATSYFEQNDLLQPTEMRTNNQTEVNTIESVQDVPLIDTTTITVNTDENIVNKEDQQSEAPIENQNDEDTFTLDGSVYELVNEDKFSHWIEVAERYGAKLYAIPYSDVFAIVKDGTPIVHMSTGVAASEVENAEILKQLFSRDGFEEYEGLVENIDIVAETGEEVSVTLEEYVGYSIFQEDGWLIVSW
ncbi:hypothetical protein [Bacillus sp. FJAT-50079]|uniref:hypothetical protein n=1 Tax=Bacillus sp. FJAT-50079 TaxID=2833577 RepID=UPI001BC99C05|nr:hypothetical protein [Bacillus sp. FJAT-50079]MBS4207372.1 hypothetical protein [Bacillus sp. FJAT-50079]